MRTRTRTAALAPRPTTLAAAALAATLATLAAAAPALGQQSDRQWLEDCRSQHHSGWHDRAVHCEVRPVQIATTGSLGITGSNGAVAVTGGATRAVTLRARVQVWGDSEREARENAARVRVVVDGDRVHAEPSRNLDYAVHFVAEVPAEYDLDLRVANGPLTVDDVRGRVFVEASNGPVDLDAVGGQVRAHTANGPLTVQIAPGPLAGIDVESTNGPVTLRLPSGVNARLEASTGNGPLNTSGLDVEIERPRYGPGGTIDATLGSGGPLIRARTSNGPLSIRG